MLRLASASDLINHVSIRTPFFKVTKNRCTGSPFVKID